MSSSPYVVLGNRPLDQWKVTELKEELRRRRLTIKGLKEDLIKRLDEAVRFELESSKENADNGLSGNDQSELPSDQAMTKPVVSGKAEDLMDVGIDLIEKVPSNSQNEIDGCGGSLDESKVVEADLVQEINTVGLEGEQVTQFSAVETNVEVSETIESVTALSGSPLCSDGPNEEGVSTAVLDNDGLKLPMEDVKPELSDSNTQLPQIKEITLSGVPPIGPSLLGSESQTEAVDSSTQLENDDFKCLQSDHSVQPLNNQVHEADPNLGFQVMSDSVSTESVSIIEKNELKVDVITDNVNLELDINHEMVHSSLSSVVPDGGESHPMDVEEPHDKKVSTEEIDSCNAENVDSLKNIDSGDLGPPEKLSLDRSSGDDSMEEDILETRQMEYKADSNEIENKLEKSEMPIVKEDSYVDVVGIDKPVETKAANAENVPVTMPTSVKRKFYDMEEVGMNDTAKRPHRWNVEGLKNSTTPKDSSQPAFKRISRSDSTITEVPKERIVPASSKSPTNSLRIDQFLRPFTLKAVQELLGKTGTVTNFWMDHIKTHCYVSFSSVEEAVKTRHAVYNLQWPPNGGRLLVAEFVDPQEVRARTEGPLASPATPSSSGAPTFSAAQPQPTVQHQPSPRLQVPRQQFPLPSLPPPMLPNPSLAAEHAHQAREVLPREQPPPARERVNLPPPPTVPEKVDPPIVTLDDLFRKTKATPRIYYLPLSDEQVATKLKAQGTMPTNRHNAAI